MEAAEELIVNITEEDDVLAPEHVEDAEAGGDAADTVTDKDADNKDTPETSQPKDDNIMDTEEENKQAINTGWVDIIEKENNLKLLSELNKIGKLISFNAKGKDMSEHTMKHKLAVFPIYPEDLSDPYVMSLMQKCTMSQVHFHAVKEDDKIQIKGMMELNFAKLDELNDNREQLAQFREGMKVRYNVKSDENGEFGQEWRAFARIPARKDSDQLTLFAPSLPESVTEDEMWELFPRAKEVVLVPGAPRQHAYIKFSDEETLKTAIEDLKARGPPREDFNFCRLVRFSKIATILKEEVQKKRKPSGTMTSPARPSTNVEGQRRVRPKRVRKRSNKSENVQKESEPSKAEPKAQNNSQPKAPAKTQPAKSAPPKQRTNNQKPQQSAQSQPRPKNQAGPRNKNWYNERRAMHLDRVRNAGRIGTQSRFDPKRNEGLQVLDTLLTSLGRLSAGANPALNLQNNQLRRRQPQQQQQQPQRNQNRNNVQRSNQGPGKLGSMLQRGGRNQRGRQRNAAGIQATAGAYNNVQQGPRGHQGGHQGGQDRAPGSYIPRNPPSYDRSPVKRQHSMEDLSRSADSQSRNNKRRRRNRKSSVGQDLRGSGSGQGFVDEYEATPRNSYMSTPAASNYTSPSFSRSPAYNGRNKGGQDGYRGGQDDYYGGQESYRGGQQSYRGGQEGYRGGQEGYSMLDALSRLTREADQNRSRQQSYGRFNTQDQNPMSTSLSSLYDRPSYY